MASTETAQETPALPLSLPLTPLPSLPPEVGRPSPTPAVVWAETLFVKAPGEDVG